MGARLMLVLAIVVLAGACAAPDEVVSARVPTAALTDTVVDVVDETDSGPTDADEALAPGVPMAVASVAVPAATAEPAQPDCRCVPAEVRRILATHGVTLEVDAEDISTLDRRQAIEMLEAHFGTCYSRQPMTGYTAVVETSTSGVLRPADRILVIHVPDVAIAIEGTMPAPDDEPADEPADVDHQVSGEMVAVFDLDTSEFVMVTYVSH